MGPGDYFIGPIYIGSGNVAAGHAAGADPQGLGWDGSALSGSVTNLAKNSGLKGGIFVAVMKCGSLGAADKTLAFAALINCSAGRAQSTTGLPRLIHSQGRHALLVDGRPYLILGAQGNNSSHYTGLL